MSTAKRSLYDKIFFKMEYVGDAEKDGHLFKKYKKVARFPSMRPSTVGIYILVFAAVIAIAILLSLFSTGLKPRGT